MRGIIMRWKGTGFLMALDIWNHSSLAADYAAVVKDICYGNRHFSDFTLLLCGS